MSTNLKTYLAVGYKTTRSEVQSTYSDTWDDLRDGKFEPITLLSGEGSETVIIGQVIASTDKYSNQEPVSIQGMIDTDAVYSKLAAIGISVESHLVQCYLFGAWG